MAVQYDSENGWTTWLDGLLKAKKTIPEVSRVAYKFFDALEADTSMIEWNTEELVSFVEAYGGAKDSILDFIKTTDRSNISLENYKAYLKSTGQTTSTFAGLTKKAGAALKGFGAALASMAVMWVVGEIVGKIVSSISDYTNAIIEAEKTTQEYVTSFQNAATQQADGAKQISALKKEYEELSSHVSKTGQNIDLTSEEYDRYKDIVSQLSTIMPDIATYFNSQGEKIGFVKGQLEDLNKEYDKYIQRQAAQSFVADETGKSKVDTVFENYRNQYDERTWTDQLFNSNTKKAQVKELINGIPILNTFGLKPFDLSKEEIDAIYSNSQIQDILEGYIGLSQDELKKKIENSSFTDVRSGVQSELEAILGKNYDEMYNMTAEEYNAFQQTLIAKQQEYIQRMSTANEGVRNIMVEYFKTSDLYTDTDEQTRTMIYNTISSLSDEFLKNQNFASESEMGAFANKIAEILSQSNSEATQEAMKTLLESSFETSDLPIDEYRQQVFKAVKVISEATDMSMSDTMQAFNVSATEIEREYQNYLNVIGKTTEAFGQTEEYWKQFFTKNNINSQEEYNNFLKIVEGATNAEEAVKKYTEYLESINTNTITKPFLEYTNALGETVSYTQEEFEKLFSLGDKENPFDGLINSANEYVAALKAVDTEMSTVESALKEYNEKGSISAETADKLLKANGDYSKSLVYTKDGIKLNTQALKDETKAYIDILIEKYKDQIATNENTIATNNAAIASNNRKIALNEERKAIINKTIADATDTKTKASLLSQKVKATVSNVKTSAENKKLQAEAEAAEKAANEAQEQIDLLRGDLNTVSDDAFGAYTPTSTDNSSSSTPKTKSYEKNTNRYNQQAKWLKDQENSIDKLKEDYNRINTQLETAIKLGDEEQIRILSGQLNDKSKKIQDLYADSASEGRVRFENMQLQLWDLVPQLKGRKFEDITEQDWEQVAQWLDENITAQNNIKIDMENANSDLKDANKDAIEAATNLKATVEELHGNMSSFYEAFGIESGDINRAFSKGWADEADNQIENVKSTFNALNDIFDKGIEETQNKIGRIDLRIDRLDENNPDKYTKQMDLIAQKSQINTEIAKNLADQIESIKSEFEDSLLPEDEYKSRMEELEDQYNDCIKAGKEFEDTLKDIAQEQIDNISSVEDNVMSYLEDYLKAVEDNSQKEIDAAEKTADAKKKALDKAKDALKDYQDELEKEWQAEDDRTARQEKLDQRSDLSSQRAKSLAAAASGDLEALSKVEELDKEIADIDKDIQEEATKQIRDMLKDYIAKQEDDLDKQADKIDEEIDLMKQQLEEAQKMNEELLKGESGMALVHALMNGESVKLNGQEVDLNTIRTSVDTENGNAFSYGYENETSEWQENLTKSLAAVANLESLNKLAQGNFTLQNGNILLSNGHSFDTSMLSTNNPNSIVNGLIPVDPNLLPIAPLANREAIMSSLGIEKTWYDNSEVIKKMGDIQKSIDNNNNSPALTIQGNLLNVEGNVMEDVVPLVRRVASEEIPNALKKWQKGVSRNAALIKYSR